MIQITQIIGESYDITTGEEHGKSVMLSNGFTQLAMPVTDEQVQLIIALIGDAEQRGEQPAPTPQPQRRRDRPQAQLRAVGDPIREDAIFSAPGQEEVAEPGESYDDDTGTASV